MNKKALIGNYTYKLKSPACHPGADSWSLQIRLTEDISEVLPYINAELHRADFNRKAGVLVWKGKGKKFAFRPKEISVAPVKNREDADAFCREAVGLVNDIWQRRNEIEPDYTRLELPSVMEIYSKLPKTNCKECGYPTCMAFAAAYRLGEAAERDCPQMPDP